MSTSAEIAAPNGEPEPGTSLWKDALRRLRKNRLAVTVSDDTKVELFIRNRAYPINEPQGGINTFIFDENTLVSYQDP